MFKNLLAKFGIKPKFSEAAKAIGIVTYVLRGPDGKIKDYRVVPNLITNAGFDYICDAMGKSASRPAAMEYIAIGSGSTAAAVTDTTIGIGGAELARQIATYAHTTGTKVYTQTTTFAAGTGTGSVQDSGMLNAASVGTLLNRQTFSVINKGASDTLQVTWTITLS